MDLKEYLIRSKSQRRELVNIASSYAIKSIEIETACKDSGFRASEITIGPTPQGLKKFESEVNNQLQKIFRPDIDPDYKSNKQSFRHVYTIKKIKKIYSNNSHLLMKKKPITLMPTFCKTPMRIRMSILYEKHKAASPYSPMKDLRRQRPRVLNDTISKFNSNLV